MGKRKNVAAPPSQNYVVEKVLDRYFDELGKKWFLLKWSGYPEDQATWEPETNVDCTGLIKEYEKKCSKKCGGQPSGAWSLKQGSGCSTKIVLKKVKLQGECVKDTKVKIKLKLNGNSAVSDSSSSVLPERRNKRRRSSTIGVEVEAPRKRGGGRKKTSEEPPPPVLQEPPPPVLQEPPPPVPQAVSSEEYMVESIQDKCLDANGRILYLIKWIGYDHVYNTWEPVENLNCPAILHEFNLKNKIPKVIVSKILDKRKVEGKTQYLVKISGCRKESWMFEKELHCLDLLREFNREYDAKNKKFSLADIADDCSSSNSLSESESETEQPKSVIKGGIKINKNCTTSSDEDDLSPMNKKKFTASNGKLLTKSRKSSSSSTGSSDVDFEDLLRRVHEKPLDSAPPSPPEEMASPIKPSPLKAAAPKLEQALQDLVKKEEEPVPEIRKEEPVPDVKKEERLLEVKKEAETKPPLSHPPVAPPDPPSPDSEQDEDKFPSIPIAKFELPHLVIPRKEEFRPPRPKFRQRSPPPSPPSYNYPGILTSDRGRVKAPSPSPAHHAPLASFVKHGSDDSDSDESLSDLENKLAAALKDPPDPDPDPPKGFTDPPDPDPDPPKGFTGVDLGALIFTETDKTADTSLNMSGLLDTIVSHTVSGNYPTPGVSDNSLQTAFLDTSLVEKDPDQSHSELFAVVAEHSGIMQNGNHQSEMDSVLGELFKTAADGSKRPSSDEEEEVEPLDPPLNDIIGADHVIKDKPAPKPARVDVPFSSLDSMLSTFKPSKKPPPDSMLSTFKPSKKPPSSVRTFSRKAPLSSRPAPGDHIFSDIGDITRPPKRTLTTSHPCPHCTRKFKDRSKLEYHTSFKHPQLLEMSCEGCSATFQSAIEYQCHQLTCGQDEDHGSEYYE